MGKLNIFASRLAAFTVLQAAGVGLALPAVFVSRPITRHMEWLPVDNQTVYIIEKGESRRLELNTSIVWQSPIFITVSPCSRNMHSVLYQGNAGSSDAHLTLLKEYNGREMTTFTVHVLEESRYVLQLSSDTGGAVAVSVRGETMRPIRLRLRVRSRRRLSANWDPSPIDPQSTTYCVVASHRKNYTSLCAAHLDMHLLEKHLEVKDNYESEMEFFDQNITSERTKQLISQINSTNLDGERVLFNSSKTSHNEMKTDVGAFDIYDGHLNNVYRRKKFNTCVLYHLPGRSTKVSDRDPLITCIGERTHHSIENLDPSTTYFVSVFGVARDQSAGTFLASASVRPRTSTARRLRENYPHKSEVKGRNVYYFKSSVGAAGGIWLSVTTCGGAVDIEVLTKGKKLHVVKNIDPHTKFFVPAPMLTSSIQESSDEGSIQFDSSSEEAKVRYVIKVTSSRSNREGPVIVEIAASTSRWGINTPELVEDGNIVRELRQRRSCRTVEVAFLPATHQAADVIRYCIVARENVFGNSYACALFKKSPARIQCINHAQRSPLKAIVQKINGLKAGRKYGIQVTASYKGSIVPYNVLYVLMNDYCKIYK